MFIRSLTNFIANDFQIAVIFLSMSSRYIYIDFVHATRL